MKRVLLCFLLCILVGISIYFFGKPYELSKQAWGVFSLFISTMLALMLNFLPLGMVSILSLTIGIMFRLFTFEEAFVGFSNEVVWLVVLAFFISRGFSVTGLGNRIALKILSLFGKNPIGLGLGIGLTSVVLAPAIPSSTARGGGIIFPLIRDVIKLFDKDLHDCKMASFLTLVAFHANTITNSMFITAMAGNPLIVKLVTNQGIEISWANWALAASVPAILSLISSCYLIFFINRPNVKTFDHVKQISDENLKNFGKISTAEKIMIFTFIFLIIFWIFGSAVGLSATIVALLGLLILLLTGVLKWKNISQEHAAWDTFIWFASLVTLASFLDKFGIATWFSNFCSHYVSKMSWQVGFAILSLIYFYSHYFFASTTAHISAFFYPFLLVALSLGTPKLLAFFVLAFFSSLCGGLTHYGSGPSPIFFSAGHVSVKTWWSVGFKVSVVNILIWTIIGGIWWKVLNFW